MPPIRSSRPRVLAAAFVALLIVAGPLQAADPAPLAGTDDGSVLYLLKSASLLVKLVMAFLVGVSVVSWWFIFLKLFTVRRERRQTEEFENAFRTVQAMPDLTLLLQNVMRRGQAAGTVEKICLAGYQEMARLRRPPVTQNMQGLMDGVRRAMRATYQREMDKLEAHLNFLATVGSVSPYVGLFGTVWGIMNSFRGLSVTAQTTLQSVAPGIAEALIATAIGLFAAIPAVVAYNHFGRDVDRLANRFESQMEEFQNLLQRNPAV
jgi:biopolymer transport protein TolQ